MMKLSIYNTDEENLLLVPKPTGKWISCEIFRCGNDEIGISSLVQYEVWKISYDPDLGEINRRFLGAFDFLREAFEQAHHVAAESKNIKELSESLKDLEDTLLEEEEALEALEKELIRENEHEIQEFSNSLLMSRLVSRSIN